MRIVTIERQAPSLSGIVGAVEAMGSDEFAPHWVRLVRESCGAVFVSAFRISNGQAKVLVSDGLYAPDIAQDHTRRYADGMYWRDDPAMAYASAGAHRGEQSSTTLVHVDPSRINSAVLKREFYRPAGIDDKLSISATRGKDLFVVSLLHTRDSGRFTDAVIEQIAGQADMFIGLLAKHCSLAGNTVTENLLASVSIIEARLQRAEGLAGPWRLTHRERQVCARILFGLTAAGIAIDLGINEYSVDTYRKRAYCRLGLATRHELLRWYLALEIAPHTTGERACQGMAGQVCQ